MGHVQINLFGSFHVERDGKSVDEQLARSPKGMLLMQYLILAPRQTAEAKTLMQVMWPEENSTSPDTALKTLISRQRALLREISPELAMCLVTVRGGYRWVCPPEVSVDVLEFEEMLARMKLPGGATPSEEMLTRMLVLYQGRLLADQQPQPAWLYNRSERLHQQFLQTVDSRLAQLQQAGHVHRYVALVRRAIDADPTNEALQQRLIEGLRQTERDTDADQQVELAARLNSAARDEMMADYYDRIQRASRALETGLVQFKEELMRGEDNNRAIVCDRRVFRSLFCLQRRGMERTGGHALLGILTLTELDPASEKAGSRTERPGEDYAVESAPRRRNYPHGRKHDCHVPAQRRRKRGEHHHRPPEALVLSAIPVHRADAQLCDFGHQRGKNEAGTAIK